MSSDLHWSSNTQFDTTIDRIKTFSRPLSPANSGQGAGHLQEFASVIENVIVPRLLMGHVQNKPERKPEIIHESAVSDFIKLTMNEDPDMATGYVRNMLESGVSFQNVLLKLLAPAARELGARWEHDTTSFLEVTLGVARMHRILREFDGVPASMWSQAGAGHHGMLLPTPGEHHTFGLRLVQEFLLRESWSVTNCLIEQEVELEKLVANQYFCFAGLSLSGETLIDSLMSAIRTIRKKSKNRSIKIIVGGHLFAERPELVKRCGADACGSDALSSVEIVNSWASELSAVT